MLHPLIPFAMRGVAWYQGESNVGNARYAKHLKILVNDWRQRWGIGDFPFYSCQLAGFGPAQPRTADSPWAECREMQTALLDLPNTDSPTFIDTCEDGDLHPLNKHDVGRRLALVALTNTYRFKDLACSGLCLIRLRSLTVRRSSSSGTSVVVSWLADSPPLITRTSASPSWSRNRWNFPVPVASCKVSSSAMPRRNG